MPSQKITRFGVIANVFRLPNGQWSYRWLGSAWHEGDEYGSVERATEAATADVTGRGLDVEVVFG